MAKKTQITMAKKKIILHHGKKNSSDYGNKNKFKSPLQKKIQVTMTTK
jgi:hypothetical protein